MYDHDGYRILRNKRAGAFAGLFVTSWLDS